MSGRIVSATCLLMQGKENGVNIDEGPFRMETLRETLNEGTKGALHLRPKRPRVYSDLTSEEKERYNADIRATNILLQGLPKDIYSLINHYTDAKDIWDNVKMLLKGSELTKEDRESQLMQLNSKFVNNMLPEWGRFVRVVKLNIRLKDSNYDQLYAYLKQHEAHANENKMMLDRFTQQIVDPLALMSNVSNLKHYPQSSTTPPSTYIQPHSADATQLDSGLSPTDSGLSSTDNLIKNLTNTLALLNQSYKTYLPQTNNQLKTSLNPRNQATIQDGRIVIQNVQGRYNRGQRNNENEVELDEEQLLFIIGRQDNNIDEDVDEQPAPTAQTMFMANLSSANPVYDEAGLTYDSGILSEYVKDNAVPVVQSNVSSVPNDAYMIILNDMHDQPVQYDSVTTHNNVVNKSLTAELATYKEQVKLYKRRARFELTEREQKIDK
uniref:Integrase, catalytic region, zinc finger, CCHC-type, peptidase aspartic, catalytic n=1 Tax=Tanacetum cinerariifolium TaxID=118510 RepID=A0A6L2NNN6_TANCI|nr:hypothetical protein [Tanacetum cinerariifolium]